MRVLSKQLCQMNYRFLKAYREDVLGPVQKSEALFLYGLTCVIHPKLVLEIGSAKGHSTRCFLEAGAGRVISVDLQNSPELNALAATFSNLTIVRGCQQSFDLSCLASQQIELFFLDASHRYDLDCATFARLKPFLAPRATLVVHDTGVWQKKFMRPHHFRHISRRGEEKSETCIHQPDVLRFVDWLKSQGMQCIELTSENCLRHGLSLLQFTL